MIRKLILTVGILGALAAAEGLNRFGGLVSAFGGVGAPFYIGMLIVSVLGAAVFLLVLIREIESRRQVGRLCRVCCLFRLDAHTVSVLGAAVFLLMRRCRFFDAPAFPVNIQILFGLAVATSATVWVRPAS